MAPSPVDLPGVPELGLSLLSPTERERDDKILPLPLLLPRSPGGDHRERGLSPAASYDSQPKRTWLLASILLYASSFLPVRGVGSLKESAGLGGPGEPASKESF